LKKRSPLDETCPCGSGEPLPRCCGRYLDGGVAAPTAEALMRSRYVAYALGREAYLLATWHASTRPAALELEAQALRWIGLDIKRFEARSEDEAVVEFVARCKAGGRAQRMHEVSRFVREQGRWYYTTGEAGEH
jgi:SEC-C motif-containing protein